MSVIFTPRGVIVPPVLKDGVENLVTRQQGASTSSLTFATIGETRLEPNTFDAQRDNSRVAFEYFGQLVGIAGIKQFRTRFDGVDVYVPASFNTLTNPGSFRVRLTLIYRGTQLFAFMRTIAGDGATGALNVNSLGSPAVPFNFDPAIQHTVTLQALVANAADLVRCDWIGASFR